MTSNQARKIGRTVLNVLLCCGAAAVIFENVSLIRENRLLRTIDDRYTAQIQAGQKLGASLTAIGSDGRLASIPLPVTDKEHLLIITFSPGCPSCRANQEKWTKLAGALEQRGWHVLWVSRDPLDASVGYAREHQIQLANVLADPPYRTYVQLGLSRVPNTLVVLPGGTIGKVWPGQLESVKWKEVFEYFNLEDERSVATNQ